MKKAYFFITSVIALYILSGVSVMRYPININNEWYFEGEVFKRTTPKKTEDKAEVEQ